MSGTLGAPTSTPNYPPQLHLSIPPTTTSFKRSFEQFGFDLDDSPVNNAGSSFGMDVDSGSSGSANSGERNERNKRARSASSLSNDSSSGHSERASSSSTSSSSRGRGTAGSSTTSLSVNVDTNYSYPSSSSTMQSMTGLAASSSSRLLNLPLALPDGETQFLPHPTLPPRLPTPEIIDVDVDIAMSPPAAHNARASSSSSSSTAVPTSPSFPLPPLSLSLPNTALTPLHAELNLDVGTITQITRTPGPSSPTSWSHDSTASPSTQQQGRVARTLEQFTVFDSHIDALRHTPPLSSNIQAPPTLPPLQLDLDSPRHLQHRRTSSSESSSSSQANHTPASTSEQNDWWSRPNLYLDVPTTLFDPLDVNLDNGEGSSSTSSPTSAVEDQQPSRPYVTTNQPPTLPPITTTTTVIWDAGEDSSDSEGQNTLAPGVGDSDVTQSAPDPSSQYNDFHASELDLNVSLRNHVPPSPSLTDLRRWIDNGGADSSSTEARFASSHSAASVGGSSRSTLPVHGASDGAALRDVGTSGGTGRPSSRLGEVNGLGSLDFSFPFSDVNGNTGGTSTSTNTSIDGTAFDAHASSIAHGVPDRRPAASASTGPATNTIGESGRQRRWWEGDDDEDSRDLDDMFLRVFEGDYSERSRTRRPEVLRNPVDVYGSSTASIAPSVLAPGMRLTRASVPSHPNLDLSFPGGSTLFSSSLTAASPGLATRPTGVDSSSSTNLESINPDRSAAWPNVSISADNGTIHGRPQNTSRLHQRRSALRSSASLVAESGSERRRRLDRLDLGLSLESPSRSGPNLGPVLGNNSSAHLGAQSPATTSQSQNQNRTSNTTTEPFESITGFHGLMREVDRLGMQLGIRDDENDDSGTGAGNVGGRGNRGTGWNVATGREGRPLPLTLPDSESDSDGSVEVALDRIGIARSITMDRMERRHTRNGMPRTENTIPVMVTTSPTTISRRASAMDIDQGTSTSVDTNMGRSSISSGPTTGSNLNNLRRYIDSQMQRSEEDLLFGFGRQYDTQPRTATSATNTSTNTRTGLPFLPIPALPSPSLDVEFVDRVGNNDEPRLGLRSSYRSRLEQQRENVHVPPSATTYVPYDDPASRLRRASMIDDPPRSFPDALRQVYRERGRQASEGSLSRAMLGYAASGASSTGLPNTSAAESPSRTEGLGSSSGPSANDNRRMIASRILHLERANASGASASSTMPTSTLSSSATTPRTTAATGTNASRPLSEMFTPGPYQNTFRLIEAERLMRANQRAREMRSTDYASITDPSTYGPAWYRGPGPQAVLPSRPVIPPETNSSLHGSNPSTNPGYRNEPSRPTAMPYYPIGYTGLRRPPSPPTNPFHSPSHSLSSLDRPTRPLPSNPPSTHSQRLSQLRQHTQPMQASEQDYRARYLQHEPSVSAAVLGNNVTSSTAHSLADASGSLRLDQTIGRPHPPSNTGNTIREPPGRDRTEQIRDDLIEASARLAGLSRALGSVADPTSQIRDGLRRRYLQRPEEIMAWSHEARRAEDARGSSANPNTNATSGATTGSRARVRARPRGLAEFRRRLNGFSLGDFVPDEEFDDSYETLLSLTEGLGEVKARNTPASVLESLESGVYGDWASDDCDKRCPICLDDYGPTDPVMKLNRCPHWMHKDCLQQWLKGATTCPVCRNSVLQPPSPRLSSSTAASSPPTPMFHLRWQPHVLAGTRREAGNTQMEAQRNRLFHLHPRFVDPSRPVAGESDPAAGSSASGARSRTRPVVPRPGLRTRLHARFDDNMNNDDDNFSHSIHPPGPPPGNGGSGPSAHI